MAVAAGFNAEGGSRHFNFATRRTESEVNHGGNGLYFLDEPEAALSPQRQLSLLVIIDRLVRQRASQLIIATHSPILMAYPRARIYLLGAPSGAIETIRYEDTEHYQITRDFLTDRKAFLRELLEGDGD